MAVWILAFRWFVDVVFDAVNPCPKGWAFAESGIGFVEEICSLQEFVYDVWVVLLQIG